MKLTKKRFSKKYNPSVGGGIRLQKVCSRGRVNYDIIPELKLVDLEKYRHEGGDSWRVTFED